jgi:arginine/ornithine N-succinyltransferase beta subunit
LTIVTKRSGETEEFDRKKIEDSLRNAGVNWESAKEIAGRIQEKDGMSSSEIRKAVKTELKIFDHGLSERYSNTRRFTVRNSVKNAKGTARLSGDSFKAMRIKAGDTLEIKYRDRWQKMRIEKDNGTSSHNEIILNRHDMDAMGVIEGNRVKARKH